MEAIQKKQMMSTYDLDALMATLLFEKIDDHEQRILNVESGIEELRESIRLKNYMTDDNQIPTIKVNTRRDDYINHKIENERAGRRLENIVLELKEIDDKRLQIQIVGELVDEIKGMLKDIPRQKNNYRRQMLLMFHEALKQNYTKELFGEKQLKALIEIARICNETFVTREQYFKMDDILCDCNLDMMPDLE